MKIRIGFVSNSSSSSFIIFTNFPTLQSFENFSLKCDDENKYCARRVYDDIKRNFDQDFSCYSNLSIKKRKRKFYNLFFKYDELECRKLSESSIYDCHFLNEYKEKLLLDRKMKRDFDEFFSYLQSSFGSRGKKILEVTKKKIKDVFDNDVRHRPHDNTRYSIEWFVSRLESEIIPIVYTYGYALGNNADDFNERNNRIIRLIDYLACKYSFKELIKNVDFSKTYFTVLEYFDDCEEGSFIEHELFDRLNDIMWYRISHH